MTDAKAATEPPETAQMRHRMANTLQLLAALARMRSQRSEAPETRRQLLWVADAVGSLGALERRRRPEGVDFAGYLEEMAPIWRRRHAASRAELVVEAAPLALSDNAASTLALVAQELVANALLHGYPDEREGVVAVRLLRPAADRCELVVVDDGVGFAAAEERFGLWLVRSLAAQVRGEFELTPGPGVTGRLQFPL